MDKNPKRTYTDDSWISAIQQGGAARQSATSYWYKKHLGLIRKAQHEKGLSEQSAKDAYADAVLGLIRQVEKKKFQQKSSLFTYFYRIYLNKCADQMKREATNEEKRWTSDFPQLEDRAADLLERMFHKETFVSLSPFFEKIGDKCKNILMDAEYWGFKPEEIAQKYGFKNAQTAKSQKYKCLQKIRRLMAQHYG